MEMLALTAMIIPTIDQVKLMMLLLNMMVATFIKS